jgi:hypothetical protein
MWAPVTREAFEKILSEEVGSLAEEVLRTYQRYAVPVFQHRCFRDTEYGIENLFVVARAMDLLLFYDDVEEDFGVATPDGDGVLRNWKLSGPLVSAVLNLDREASGH